MLVWIVCRTERGWRKSHLKPGQIFAASQNSIEKQLTIYLSKSDCSHLLYNCWEVELRPSVQFLTKLLKDTSRKCVLHPQHITQRKMETCNRPLCCPLSFLPWPINRPGSPSCWHVRTFLLMEWWWGSQFRASDPGARSVNQVCTWCESH